MPGVGVGASVGSAVGVSEGCAMGASTSVQPVMPRTPSLIRLPCTAYTAYSVPASSHAHASVPSARV